MHIKVVFFLLCSLLLSLNVHAALVNDKGECIEVQGKKLCTEEYYKQYLDSNHLKTFKELSEKAYNNLEKKYDKLFNLYLTSIGMFWALILFFAGKAHLDEKKITKKFDDKIKKLDDRSNELYGKFSQQIGSEVFKHLRSYIDRASGIYEDQVKAQTFARRVLAENLSDIINNGDIIGDRVKISESDLSQAFYEYSLTFNILTALHSIDRDQVKRALADMRVIKANIGFISILDDLLERYSEDDEVYIIIKDTIKYTEANLD